MAENSFPFYGVETSETQFSQWGELLLNSGVVSGLDVTAGAGMSVNVAAGVAFMRGRYYENTTPKNVAITAAPGAGLTRKDFIILKIDLTANTVVVTKKDGTTAGGGTLPALQQDTNVWELAIAAVSVANGTVSITNPMITARRPLTGLRVFPYADEIDRPTPVLSVLALGVNTSTRILELWVGGAWVSLTPDVTWAGITGKPGTFTPSAHSHVQGDVTGLAAALAGKAAAVHDHDDRYYQKTTLDTALGGKSNTGHTHVQGDITGLVTALGNKSDTSHTHSPTSIGTWNYNISTGWSIYSAGLITAALTPSWVLGGAWQNVYVDNAGVFGVRPSTIKAKNPLGDYCTDFDGWMGLSPRWFAYKVDEQQRPRLGLYAEDLNPIAPELVNHEDGEPTGIKYEDMPVALLSLIQTLNARVVELEKLAGVKPVKPKATKANAPTKAMLASAAKAAAAQRKRREQVDLEAEAAL